MPGLPGHLSEPEYRRLAARYLSYSYPYSYP
jgi:hypothetical protein